MTNVIVAVNAIFVVCLDRRDDFLAHFHNQIKIELPPPTNNNIGGQPPTLLQAVLGEDFETPGTFHCHLKFEFPSLRFAKEVINSSRRFNDQGVFLNGVSKEWVGFEATNPYQHNTESYSWTIAPLAENSPRIRNPKQPQQKRDQQSVLFCLNANLHIQPQHREEFRNVLENARAWSIQEPLCVEYQYGESMTTPNTFHVHQSYIGEEGGKEGFDIHKKTPHYQIWKKFAVKKPFTKSPVGHPFLTPISPVSPPGDNNGGGKQSTQSITTSSHRSIIVLDGGNGHELKQRGIITDGSFLAGVVANEKEPTVVKAVHRDFCQSGCHVLTTNSFVAVPQRVQEDILTVNSNEGNVSGCGSEVFTQEATIQRTRELISAAVKCARDVANEKPERLQGVVRVAGSLGPLTTCYKPSMVPQDLSALVSTYTFLLSTLIEEEVDLMLAETLSTEREGIAIIRALSQISIPTKNTMSLPLWLSFTIDDFKQPTVLRSGESLEKALDAILDEAKTTGIQLQAIGVNCASPGAVTNAIPCLVEAVRRRRLRPSPRILAYANAFQTTTSDWLASLNGGSGALSELARESLVLSVAEDYDLQGVILPEVYARYAVQWREMGASIIGGCCGCSPLHMQAVTSELVSKCHG